MKTIERLMDRNQYLIDLIDSINIELERCNSATNTLKITPTITKLLWSVNGHISFEERVFYPNKIKSIGVNDYITIFNFTKFLPVLRNAIETYKNQWSSFANIRIAYAKYLVDTKLIISAIANLARLENEQIYPLLNQHHKSPINILHKINFDMPNVNLTSYDFTGA